MVVEVVAVVRVGSRKRSVLEVVVRARRYGHLCRQTGQ